MPQKNIRSNNAGFIIKELQKIITEKTGLKNYYSRRETEHSRESYIKQTTVYIERCQILMVERVVIKGRAKK